MSTVKASLGRWIEAVNQADNVAFDVRNMLEDAHEFTTGKVAYLAPPKSLHPLHGQVFKEQMIEGIGQFMSELEEPVTALINDRLIDASDDHLGFLPATRKFNFTSKILLGDLEFSHCLTIVQRTFNLFSNRGDQESFQPKVKPDAVTRSELIILGYIFLYHKVQIEITKAITFDRDSLNVCWNVAGLAEFVDRALNLDLVATKQLPTSLLEGETAVLLDFLKAWGRGFNLVLKVAEEQLIGFVDTINNVLNRLTANQIPMLMAVKLFQLGDMFHQNELVQTLAGQFVVFAVQRNAVVIDQATDIDLLVQQLILLRPIKLELVRLDDFHTFFWFSIYCMMTASGAPPTVQTK